MFTLDLSLIEQATSFLEGKIRKTPLEFSPALSDLLHVPAYFKLECLQTTGSFKIRGALFYLSTLTSQEKHNGVAACSAGNHGLAIAFAAQQIGVECTVFVPRGIDHAKYKKILKLGATIKESAFTGYDDTLAWAKEEASKNGWHLISAFDDERIMAGNGGSLAVEILDQLPDAENVIVPVGGGGLPAGIAYYAKTKKPELRIIGCQHINSPALKLSLECGHAVTRLPAVDTIAGGIEGGIGTKCFEILKHRVKDVALLSEDEIIKGLRWMLENHQYLIEPTSAVTIASCIFNKIPNLKGPTVIILTGRNVSYTTLQRLLG